MVQQSVGAPLIQFRQHVIQDYQGRLPVQPGQQPDLAHLQGQDHGALLALGGVHAGVPPVQPDDQVIPVGTPKGVAPPDFFLPQVLDLLLGPSRQLVLRRQVDGFQGAGFPAGQGVGQPQFFLAHGLLDGSPDLFQLLHEVQPPGDDGHTGPHQLFVKQVGQFLASTAPANVPQEAVPLPQHRCVLLHFGGVPGPALGNEQVQKAAPEAGGSLHQGQIVGEESYQRQMAQQIAAPSYGAAVEGQALGAGRRYDGFNFYGAPPVAGLHPDPAAPGPVPDQVAVGGAPG